MTALKGRYFGNIEKSITHVTIFIITLGFATLAFSERSSPPAQSNGMKFQLEEALDQIAEDDALIIDLNNLISEKNTEIEGHDDEVEALDDEINALNAQILELGSATSESRVELQSTCGNLFTHDKQHGALICIDAADISYPEDSRVEIVDGTRGEFRLAPGVYTINTRTNVVAYDTTERTILTTRNIDNNPDDGKNNVFFGHIDNTNDKIDYFVSNGDDIYSVAVVQVLQSPRSTDNRLDLHNTQR